jgi:hypothetical protein
VVLSEYVDNKIDLTLHLHINFHGLNNELAKNQTHGQAVFEQLVWVFKQNKEKK